MSRASFVLLIVFVFCALGVVTAQHRARQLFIELEQQEKKSRQYQIEWGQLQLEQSTWAMHARVEKIAVQQLNMHVPSSKEARVLHLKDTPESLKKGPL